MSEGQAPWANLPAQKKSLYGLRTAPANFNRHLHGRTTGPCTADCPAGCMAHPGFEQCLSDSSLYRRKSDLGVAYAALWVNDILCCGDAWAVDDLQHKLKAKFEIRDYGEPKVFLGMDIDRDHQKAHFICPSVHMLPTWSSNLALCRVHMCPLHWIRLSISPNR